MLDTQDRSVTDAGEGSGVTGAENVARPSAEAHPFARFVRAIGRGHTLSRSLTAGEAADAMRMILADEVEAVQLGAFLLVLRYRKETPEELAGFVRAARDFCTLPDQAHADLDWPSYADRHRQLPYFVLAALLLARSGIRVLMHGINGSGPATTPATLRALGIEPCASAEEAMAALDQACFAYLPLEAFCPALLRLFALRPLLGLRSPANTFARELNPFAAPSQLQGVFHPTYLPTHQETARLLGQPRAAVFKGGGGEIQRNPAKPCRVATLHDDQVGEEIWPALVPGTRYAWREEALDPARVVALWHGEARAPAPEAAIIGTAAIALKLAGRAETPGEADAMARDLWEARSTATGGAAALRH